jgi:hypothetical protein
LRDFFGLSVEHGIPRLHVHERFEREVKWGLRLLTVAGIVASVISFKAWYLNLLLAVMLTLVEQFLERSVFIFTTLFLTPIPESYRPSDWCGVVWGIPAKTGFPFIVGLAFSTQEAAGRIFPCIRAWNYDSDEDPDDNICVSVIMDGLYDYFFFVYPNTRRRSVREYAEEAKRKNPGKEHMELVVQLTLCKKLKRGGHFEAFRANYIGDKQYLLVAYYMDGPNFVPIPELGEITKQHLKVRDRNELTASEREYQHLGSFKKA